MGKQANQGKLRCTVGIEAVGVYCGEVGITALSVDLHLIRGVVEVVGLVEEKCLQCLLEEDCVMAEEVSDAFYSWMGVISYLGWCYSPFLGGLFLKTDLFWDIPNRIV